MGKVQLAKRDVYCQEPSPFASSGEIPVLCRLQSLASIVDGLMAEWIGSKALIAARKSHRVPTRQFFGITPLCDETFEPLAESCRVQAYDLGTDGLSFIHQNTLPFRMVAATFQLADGELESVVTRLKWCRFTREGHYRSGGQFVRTIHLGWEESLMVEDLTMG